MSKILFINHAAEGHLNSLLSIALQMKKEGHDVMFAIPGVDIHKYNFAINNNILVWKKIKEKNINIKIIKPPLSMAFFGFILPFKRGFEELRTAIRLFTSGLGYFTKKILQIINEYKPDTIVSDFSFFSGYIAALISNTPCAIVFHSGLPFKGEKIPPFGSGLAIGGSKNSEYKKYENMEAKLMNKVDKKINKVLLKYSQKPLKKGILRRPYSKWLNLITSHEYIEVPRNNLNKNTFFIGPCFSNRRKNNSNFPFEKLNKEKFKIYISLGTVFNNKPKIFEKIINSLKDEKFQLIVSAGRAYEKLKKLIKQTNVFIFKNVPQIELLPKVDLVIGHGGNNSTNETLASGKPIIIIPIGGEQSDNGSRIEYLKFGFKLDMDKFTEMELLKKVQEIIKNPIYRENTEKAKNEIAQTNALKTASKLICNLTKINQNKYNSTDK